MHHAAHGKTAHGTAGKVQSRTLLHVKVPNQTPLGEKVRRQLHRAPKACPDHGGADAAIQPAQALGAEDGVEPVPCAAVLVLRAHGPERREALQARLDEEEGAAGTRADDARGGAAEHVDAQVLGGAVPEEQGGEAVAHGLVEAQAAAVEEDLVDVGGAEAAVDGADALVPHDDADAVEGPAVVVRLMALVLEFALQLHADRGVSLRGRRWDRQGSRREALPDLDRFKRVRGRHGAASGNAAGDEGAVEGEASAGRSILKEALGYGCGAEQPRLCSLPRS